MGASKPREEIPPLLAAVVNKVSQRVLHHDLCGNLALVRGVFRYPRKDRVFQIKPQRRFHVICAKMGQFQNNSSLSSVIQSNPTVMVQRELWKNQDIFLKK